MKMLKWLVFAWGVPLFLSLSISPDLYELSIEPLLEHRNETYDFVGNVTIHFHDGFGKNVIILDSIGLSVQNLTMDGKDVDFLMTDEEILIFPDDPLRVDESHRIEVHYTGIYSHPKPSEGLSIESFQISEKESSAFVYTQLEEFFARKVFPCVDWPNKKANFSLQIIHPVGSTALSNGAQSSQVRRGRKLITSFKQPPHMSTYLVAFVVGQMKTTRRRTNGIDLAVHYFKSPRRNPEAILDDIEYSLMRMTEITGTRYPMEKLDWAVLGYSISAGAMENFGLITSLYTQTRQPTVFHEVVHQWIGNLVTIASFRDIFIQEGWTEYYTQRLLMEKAMDKILIATGLISVLNNALSIQTSGSLLNKEMNTSEWRYYSRGSSFFRMLADVFGQDSMDRLLRELIRIYGYQNHDHRQFFDLYKSIVDPNLLPTDYDHFIESWIQNEKFNPIISVDYSQNQYKISLVNTNVTLAQGFPDVPVKLLTLPANDYRVVWMNKDVTSFTIEAEEGSEYIVVDPNIHGFYLLHHSTDYLNKIQKSKKYADFEYQIKKRHMMRS